ncbi:serine hydrolase domain-containing protein [Luteimonas kalidii]|uniref:Serine hydrolase n=1 Tax=Luteimonas kalidii TaxID=3042025 RepID=A0ABT6JX93_9GAMM|nr:serine hydrolase domain-containing protein [Luteimonas kalidii]MDH5835092.1 serine hydrolase [Luteimonas kalidii]
MTRSLALLLACCLPLAACKPSFAALAENKAPPAAALAGTDAAARARQAADAWLAAFNAGDRASLEAYAKRWNPELDVERMLAFRNDTGGFRLVRREDAPAGAAHALVQERESDSVARIAATITPEGHARLEIEVVEPPEDLRVARLSQQDTLDALVAKADAQAAKDAFSGVLLVARGDEVLLQRAWGTADRAAGTPVAMDTKFRVGSMNKMFTAVATLQLVQAGQLSLDDTVGAVLRGYPNADVAQVTIRQLLTHAGGTGDIFGPEFDAKRLSLKTHEDYVRLYGARGTEHAPGTEQRYSNYGFLLLGRIIEQASGQSYYDYVDAHVFGPAGMRDSGSLPEDVAVPGRAVAYTRRDDAWVDAADTLPYRGTSAGGGYSTAGDLLKFARALQDGTLLSPDLLAEATRNQTPWYGYGFMAREQDGVRFFGHGGGAPGMNGDLRIYPASGVVVLGLSNLDPPVVERLVSYYLLRMPE